MNKNEIIESIKGKANLIATALGLSYVASSTIMTSWLYLSSYLGGFSSVRIELDHYGERSFEMWMVAVCSVCMVLSLYWNRRLYYGGQEDNDL